MWNSVKSSVAVADLAIAFSADAFLPDTMPPIFVGQAFGANANSEGKGRSGENDDRGRSADAGSRSGDASSSGGPASSQGKGGGLLRLLTGSARPLSPDSAAPVGVATGAPLQLLPPQANDGTGSPVTAYVKETTEITGQKPGEIHRLLGAGHSYFNSDDHAKQNAAYESRIKRVKRYLQANAALQATLTANGGVTPTVGEYDAAQAYLNADAVLAAELAAPGSYTPEEIIAAQAIIDNSLLADATATQAVIDAYEAEAVAIAAFEEADNQPYDPVRRAVYDALAAEHPL